MSIEIPLSRGRVALIDPEDESLALANGPWHSVPGQRTSYARTNIKRADGTWTSVYLHVLILGVKSVDHINGDGLDNRRINLRPASAMQNSYNRPVRSDSSSGFKGVTRNRSRGKPWRAQIGAEGKSIHLGLFDSAVEAALAYDVAAHELHGDFARLNFAHMEKTA